jgi:hypothetical protein
VSPFLDRARSTRVIIDRWAPPGPVIR